MAQTNRQMHLSLMLEATGRHPASWRSPETQADACTDIHHYARISQIAERAKFDMVFKADTPVARVGHLECWSRYPLYMNGLESLTLLSALAMATSKIGLGGTITTSFTEPYNVAREFASLDHISGGRAGWNVVTSAVKYIAQNFGQDQLAPHADRYERAREHVQVVKALWDTYDDDAFVRDREAGLFFDPAKLHILEHKGKHFSVRGALNVARSPQGQPVIIQAGASDDGKDFAAETAEVVFGPGATYQAAKTYYDDLKGRLAAYGREPDQLKILPGFCVLIGDSKEEAQAKFQTLQELIHPDVGRNFVGGDLEADLSDLPVDQPIPEDRIPKKANLHQAFFDHLVHIIRTEKPTLRELYLRYERSTKTHCGTAKEIADEMEEWFTTGAADGFIMQFSLLPGALNDFVEKVVPELQRRGLFRKEYSGSTLRDHFGLKRPESRYAQKPQESLVAAE